MGRSSRRKKSKKISADVEPEASDSDEPSAPSSASSSCSSASSSSSRPPPENPAFADARSDEASACCYICLVSGAAVGVRDATAAALIRPCGTCTGSIQLVHRACLDQWRVNGAGDDSVTHCSICGTAYDFEPVAASRVAAAETHVTLLTRLALRQALLTVAGVLLAVTVAACVVHRLPWFVDACCDLGLVRRQPPRGWRSSAASPCDDADGLAGALDRPQRLVLGGALTLCVVAAITLADALCTLLATRARPSETSLASSAKPGRASEFDAHHYAWYHRQYARVAYDGDFFSAYDDGCCWRYRCPRARPRVLHYAAGGSTGGSNTVGGGGGGGGGCGCGGGAGRGGGGKSDGGTCAAIAVGIVVAIGAAIVVGAILGWTVALVHEWRRAVVRDSVRTLVVCDQRLRPATRT